MARFRNLISKTGEKGVVTRQQAGQPASPDRSPPFQTADGKKLTNAAIIYGVGAALIYVLAFYNLATANWFNGLVLLIPSTSLAYLAYRYIQ